MTPASEMRWWHAGGFGMILAVLGAAWRWADKHVKYFKARLNGYTIEKK